jgi:TonB family protein
VPHIFRISKAAAVFCLLVSASLGASTVARAQRPPRQRCTNDRWEPGKYSRSLKGAAARTDSVYRAFDAAMRTEADAEAAAAGAGAPRGFIRFQRAKGGSAVTASGLHLNFDIRPEMYTRAAEALAGYPATDAFSTTLRLDTLPKPAEGARVRSCTPSITNARELTRLLSAELTANPDLVPYVEGHAGVLLRLTAAREGEAIFPEVVRSSGVARLDDLAMQVAVQALFAPASVDGTPLDVPVTIPINFMGSRSPEWDPYGASLDAGGSRPRQ